MSENTGISLHELQERIKCSLAKSFSHKVWVKGEISAVKVNNSGHCYIDIIDKDDSGELNAKAQAIIWSSSWKVLCPYFEKTTGSKLSAGMNILFLAQVQYSELYGLSLIISDIDTAYSVGEMELRRLKTIERLKEEGMMDMNSTLTLPRLPRRFAVISSESAAGYRDFMKHLHQNIYGFTFITKLFTAPMQGTSAPEGIVAAMDEVLAVTEEKRCAFDAVLILRGGGSVIDLSCFDDYTLAANIAQYPLPVMVAVGHDQDYHICDMVACVSVKTPTALADYIVDIFASEDAAVSSLSSRLALALSNKYRETLLVLENYTGQIISGVRNRFAEERGKVDLLEQRMMNGNPLHLISSGYALMRKKNMNVRSISQIEKGDAVDVVLKDGIAECQVINITKFE